MRPKLHIRPSGADTNADGHLPLGTGKEKTMLNFIKDYRANAAKRALYRRTRDEIANMPR